MKDVVFAAICDYFKTDITDQRSIAGELAEHITRAIDSLLTIDTVEQLEALPVPSADSLNGTIIRALGYLNFGEIYERNSDGTWGLLATPGSRDLDEALIASADMPLPAFILWIPSR